jgi:hypothetical protein
MIQHETSGERRCDGKHINSSFRKPSEAKLSGIQQHDGNPFDCIWIPGPALRAVPE